MKPLRDCKWAVEIVTIQFSEPSYQWSARCLTMDKKEPNRFASGSIGSLECLKLHESKEVAIQHWTQFAKINSITNYTLKSEKA